MRVAGLLFVLALAAGLSAAAGRAHADEVDGGSTPAATPETTPLEDTSPPAAAPGWRDTGLTAPLARWHAGLSVLGAVSDRYAGADEPGWLLEVAPRLMLERPPSRLSGWLAYEPAVRARAGIPPRDGVNDPGAEIHHQGSVGFAVGDGIGARVSAEGRHRITLDQLHSEQTGLVEHVQTEGEAAAEWVSPDRGTIEAHAGVMRVRYPFEGLRTADLDRFDGSFEATARFHLRMTGALRLAGSQTQYRLARNEDGSRREVQTVTASAHLQAQPMPALSVRLAGGPGIRRDPRTTFDFPITAGVTADVRRRFRVSLDGGAALEDSLWRSNDYLRVYHSRAHAAANLHSDVNLGLFAGVAIADYPEEELSSAGVLERRNDLTWGTGTEISSRLGGRLRATLSLSHTERRSTFPEYEWEENRCVLSAFVDW